MYGSLTVCTLTLGLYAVGNKQLALCLILSQVSLKVSLKFQDSKHFTIYTVLQLAAWCPVFIPSCVKLILLTVTDKMMGTGRSLPLDAICNPCLLMQ